MNKESVSIYQGKVEPYLMQAEFGAPFQLLRTGYFKLLNVKDKTVLSEIVSLKDNFNK